MAQELNVNLGLKVMFLWEREALPEDVHSLAVPCRGEVPYCGGRASDNDRVWARENPTRSEWDIKIWEERSSSVIFYLPWRAGVRPDYSEYLEAVRQLLVKAREELERRFQVAWDSAEREEGWEDEALLILGKQAASDEGTAESASADRQRTRKIMK